MSRKILLLHPEDTLPWLSHAEGWDVVVDLGRAPLSTYEGWSRRAGCEVFSLYEFAAENGDMDRLRELLHLGLGWLVDRSGIDWWDLLCLFIADDLQQLMMVHRLSKELGAGRQLYSSRPSPLATGLQRLIGGRLTNLERPFQSVIRRARHYHKALSHLDGGQLAQALEDKFDTSHSIRRRFTRRGQTSKQPFILLPSAYINVSRTALSYAELLPGHQFLLVLARSNAKLSSLPPNVRSTLLTPYFGPNDTRETRSLLESWDGLRKHLVSAAEEFNLADAVGVLGRVPALLPWGVGLRDAWTRVFESQNVIACLSADDSNPPSSIPLVLAKKRGLPALACHHGALDYQMAIKANHADFYLVKSEMEQDYLRRTCHLAPEKIVAASPVASKPAPLRGVGRRFAPWLVFFTEPYQSYGWRSDEVYRDLLPRLCSLAQTCGLKLVFKLHPFESIKGHRKMLRRIIPGQERSIEVLAGPPPDQLWNKIRCALTVQSSTALECAALGIPVFLCAWLQDSYSGYVEQYARFGAGKVLETPEQIDEVPRLLEGQSGKSMQPHPYCRAIDSDKLAALFSGTSSLPVASTA